ncbi:hypothetical protein EGT07_25265 [Herbaspirillum sp. HC18]|nr:hypothetical protein EGT07_25265 [Herbaspirillum sp. HC18]
MSIAVSTVVHPSRILLAATTMMSVSAACVGIAVGIGAVGEVLLPVRLLIAASLVFLAFFGFYHGTRNRKPIHIDISGTGQIRLRKVGEIHPCTDADRPHLNTMGEVVRLMNDTTIWPRMLILRLQAANGEITIVPVFPDGVSRHGFRALEVACRWISLQKDESESEIL